MSIDKNARKIYLHFLKFLKSFLWRFMNKNLLPKHIGQLYDNLMAMRDFASFR
jgi:hypothetical protein